MGTVRLFDEDSRLIQFEACVLSCEEEGGLYKVELTQTAFFPEEGGQTCDKGTLQDMDVLKVVEKDGIIYHYVAEQMWEGDTVTGYIDWDKRFSDMQQHSGEHIVSGLVNEYFGFDNVGFHLGSEFVTMDFNGKLSPDDLRMIELKANKVVAANKEVEVLWPSPEELAELNYRSKKELSGNVRIVRIGGVDTCACCAPHVHRTGEIGQIRLVNMVSYKGGVRVFMLCGFRALADYNDKDAIIKQLSAQLSSKQEEITANVAKLQEENLRMKNELLTIKKEQVLAEIKALSEGEAHGLFFTEELDKTAVKEAWEVMCGKFPGISGIFIGSDETGYRVVTGSYSLDAAAVGKSLTAKLGGKGGGKKEMFQGNTPAVKAQITDAFMEIVSGL